MGVNIVRKVEEQGAYYHGFGKSAAVMIAEENIFAVRRNGWEGRVCALMELHVRKLQ